MKSEDLKKFIIIKVIDSQVMAKRDLIKLEKTYKLSLTDELMQSVISGYFRLLKLRSHTLKEDFYVFLPEPIENGEIQLFEKFFKGLDLTLLVEPPSSGDLTEKMTSTLVDFLMTMCNKKSVDHSCYKYHNYALKRLLEGQKLTDLVVDVYDCRYYVVYSQALLERAGDMDPVGLAVCECKGDEGTIYEGMYIWAGDIRAGDRIPKDVREALRKTVERTHRSKYWKKNLRERMNDFKIIKYCFEVLKGSCFDEDFLPRALGLLFDKRLEKSLSTALHNFCTSTRPGLWPVLIIDRLSSTISWITRRDTEETKACLNYLLSGLPAPSGALFVPKKLEKFVPYIVCHYNIYFHPFTGALARACEPFLVGNSRAFLLASYIFG